MDSANETTPIVETSEVVEQPTTVDLDQEVEFDGVKVTVWELQKGYMRQSDYTRKTQDLAEQRKSIETPKEEVNEDVLNARSFLEEEGYVKKSDLEASEAKSANETKLQSIFMQNPELKSQEAAIRAIGQTDNSAYEDIIVKYNFSTKDKLAKAKQSNAKAMWSIEHDTPKQKSIKDMSSDEYASWKAANSVWKGSKFSSSSF